MLAEKAQSLATVVHVRDTGLPLTTSDQEWARFCRQNRLVFITEDQAIRRRPEEAEAFAKARVGYVEVRIKAAVGAERLSVYASNADELISLLDRTTPFCVVMTRSGIRDAQIGSRSRRRGVR